MSELITTAGHKVISTDLFDTVLLRDHTIEAERLAQACGRGAPAVGVDPVTLTRLRWDFQLAAYRAVAIERPDGEASLASIYSAIASVFGLSENDANVLRTAEIEVDIEHLRPNEPLLRILRRASDSGRRVIAVSDTYYSGADLLQIVSTVIDSNPIAQIYSSADVGLTKHTGRLFREVERRENVRPAEILHFGDSLSADVRMATAACWSAVHLPRDDRHRAVKLAGKVRSLRLKKRSTR